MSAKSTLLALPSHDGRIHMQILPAVLRASAHGLGGIKVIQSSILTKAFNQLWCEALNAKDKGITHFCMLHSDIAPEDFFLDKLHDIMSGVGADILSVVSPMKNHEGLTSTALESESTTRPSRFTMKQIMAGPETFTHDDLLVNTGLMLCDLRKPWAKKVCFRFKDAIVWDEKGARAENIPEDWQFSLDAKSEGATVYATRAVKLVHWGQQAYPNDSAWGQLDYDVHNGKAEL